MKKILFLLLLFIVFLSFLTYQRFSKFQKSLQGISLPEPKMPEIEEFSFEEKGEKEFRSPDGKLKIKYPASWQESGEEFLKLLTPPTEEPNEIKVLFSLYKISLPNPLPAYLIVQETSLTDLEEIKEKIEKEVKEKEGKMEILSLEKKEAQALLEARYKKAERGVFSLIHSQGKIILGKEKSYLIFVFTPEENWKNITEEVKTILDSIEILE